MATEIKSVPVLRGKVARDFVKKAKANLAKRGTVDLSKHMETTREILRKANLGLFFPCVFPFRLLHLFQAHRSIGSEYLAF